MDGWTERKDGLRMRRCCAGGGLDGQTPKPPYSSTRLGEQKNNWGLTALLLRSSAQKPVMPGHPIRTTEQEGAHLPRTGDAAAAHTVLEVLALLCTHRPATLASRGTPCPDIPCGKRSSPLAQRNPAAAAPSRST